MCSFAGTSWPGGCPAACESPTAVAQRWRAQLLFLGSFQKGREDREGPKVSMHVAAGDAEAGDEGGENGDTDAQKTPREVQGLGFKWAVPSTVCTGGHRLIGASSSQLAGRLAEGDRSIRLCEQPRRKSQWQPLVKNLGSAAVRRMSKLRSYG